MEEKRGRSQRGEAGQQAGACNDGMPHVSNQRVSLPRPPRAAGAAEPLLAIPQRGIKEKPNQHASRPAN